ncbi:DUF2218 domain-containing protein [Sphingomonas montana]|uniref:DUF2218 domain-containing protein n=1 Tax=Sphingomonas montana TaxID=1843236 RepID=UPI00096E4E2D|nr:DUF2218 domain-containing protein [Sphingomonas montana]
MPVVTTARVATPHASRYLQQLCRHWSHRFVVEHTPDAGEVALPAGPLTLTAEPDTLVLRLSVADAEEVARVQGVVAELLDRFAFREGPLEYDWRVDG